MIRRWLPWMIWMIAAAVLYFFENNTGTRLLLVWSLLLPLWFRLTKAEDSPRPAKKQVSEENRPREGTQPEASDDADTIRDYVPGDPIRRIHWKLSAKTDRILIRDMSPSQENVAEAAAVREETASPGKTGGDGIRRRLMRILLTALGALALLSVLLPGARNGMALLLNRLFDRSEAVNAYRYVRLAVPEGQSIAAAVVLLSCIGAVLAVILLTAKSRLPALIIACAAALIQAYLGLSLPAWANILLLVPLTALLLPRVWSRRRAAFCAASLAVLAALILLLMPGVDPGTEEASERVRDLLSRAAGQTAGAQSELPESVTETRHVNTQSLLSGDQESVTSRTYRLVTLEEEQISMPQWIDYLRVILYLLLTVAVLVLPFTPFVLLNRRRRRALEIRRAFDSEDRGEAIGAMFRHIVRWLESTGHGDGNRLFRDWPEALAADLPGDYVQSFAEAAPLFEEAVYSDHRMTEEQCGQVRGLLDRTEDMLYASADWKKRLRLRYVECLWIG